MSSEAGQWADSLIEQGLLQSLGMPMRDAAALPREASPPVPSPVAVTPSGAGANPDGFGSIPAFSSGPPMPLPSASSFGGDDDPFGGFAAPIPPPAAVAAPTAVAPPSMDDDFGSFGGFGGPTTTPSAPPAMPPPTSMGDDFGFGGFEASAPLVPPGAPPGVSSTPLDFDLSMLGGSTASITGPARVGSSGDLLNI